MCSFNDVLIRSALFSPSNRWVGWPHLKVMPNAVKQPAQGYIRLTSQFPARSERHPTGAVLFRLADEISLPNKRTSPGLALLAIYKVNTCYQTSPVSSLPLTTLRLWIGFNLFQIKSFCSKCGYFVTKNKGSSDSGKTSNAIGLYPAVCLEQT